MRFTLKSRLSVLIVFLSVFALSPMALFFMIPRAEAPVSALAYAEKEKFALPVRIVIPRIGVDALIEHADLTPLGVMGTPKGPKNAAWFSEGPRPGEKGSAVINGHFGWKDGIPAVFDNLHELSAGDKMYVLDSAGGTTTFIVRGLKTYGEHEESFGVFNSTDGKAHLNLITCQGKWSSVARRYSDRLVVFADEEKSGMI
jgi:sortase A